MNKNPGCLSRIFLSYRRKRRQKQSAEWAAAAYSEVSPGLRYHLLLQHIIDTANKGDLDLIAAIRDQARAIENIIVARNLRGIEFEKSGDITSAIIEYEANVQDVADTPHPYNRLRIIYKRQGDYQNAIRICETHCANSLALASICPDKVPYVEKLCDEYQSTIEKYRKKL